MSRFLTTIKIVVIFSIIIGVFAIALNTAFGLNTISYLSKHPLNNGSDRIGYYYIFSFKNYMQNLNIAINNTASLKIEYPPTNWELGDVSKSIGNILIFVANVLLYPLRISAYIINVMLGILGVNQNINDELNGLGWLVKFVQEALQIFDIEYIVI